jgi:hypothetical protein
MMSNKNWSKQEMSILYQNFDNMTLKDIQKLLPGRSYRSVCKKSIRMGMRKLDGNVNRVHTNGYVVVRRDDYPLDYPGFLAKPTSDTKARYVYAHYVEWWENCPDDPVKKGELLHHVNGDPLDNDICNLQKVKKRDHILAGGFNHVIMNCGDYDNLEIKTNGVSEYINHQPINI